jgi:hypothetical protein
MRLFAQRVEIGLMIIAVSGAGACLVQAQAPSPATKGTARSPSPADATAAASDAAKKAQILASDRWKKVEQEFAKWLSMQVIYTPQQVEQLKTKLKAEIQRMSAAELEQFLDQWDAKLKVLLGTDAAEAREWLGQYLSVVADGFRQTFLQKLGITDVSKLTAAQIEDQIENIRAQRLAFQQQRAAFDVGRQNAVNMAQQFRTQEQAALQQSGVGQAGSFGTFQTQFAPRQYDWRPAPPIVPFFW